MRLYFLLIFLLLPFVQKAQVQLEFCPVYDSVIHPPFRINETDSLTKFKFYISQIKLIGNKKQAFRPEQEHFLIDFDRDATTSRLIRFDSISHENIQKIEFTLGVDTKTSAGGIGEGVLDPINGMYWTWQSGYINFKMEGVSDKSPARKNRFQLHLGGFKKPYVSAQTVAFSIKQFTADQSVYFDLKKFMNGVNLKKQHTIMSPSKESIVLSRLAKSCFYVK
jgi:hypothetical protein